MLQLLGSFSVYSSKVIEAKKIINDCNQNERNILKTTGIFNISKFSRKILIKDIYDVLLKKAFSEINIDPVGILVCTKTKDESMPSLSSQIVFRNKLTNVDFCHDIDSGCTGFVDITRMADLYLERNKRGHVLCFTGDISSRIVDYSEYSLACVLGDLINLTVYEYIETDSKQLFSEFICPKYSLSIHQKENDYVRMDGMEVMSFVSKTVISSLEKYLNNLLNLEKSIPRTLVLHQANQFIVNFINKKIKNKYKNINFGKFSMGNTGNSSSSTIPFAISQYGQNNSLNRDLILCGFGVGMKVSIGNIKVSKSALFYDLTL
tara:strand:- start:483 stop:1442 length:960 start_codon:yes stop_codon:yes gene_type:complete